MRFVAIPENHSFEGVMETSSVLEMRLSFGGKD